MTSPVPLVLIVDDVEDQRELLAQLFMRAGCDVLCASGTSGAEEILRGRSIDIAVIDLLLRGADDGWKTVEAVREWAPATAIVISSVLDVAEFPAADGYLPKPITKAQVKQLVDQFRSSP